MIVDVVRPDKLSHHDEGQERRDVGERQHDDQFEHVSVLLSAGNDPGDANGGNANDDRADDDG
jgi:hypothetical protein